MAVTKPDLNLLYVDSHNCYSLMIADISKYPDNWNIVSPTIRITLPNSGYITVPFTPSNVNMYDSAALNITCGSEDLQPLPDGIYQFRYTINPSDKYFVEKSILRVDQFQEKFDNAFIKLDLDCHVDPDDKRKLEDIYIYLQEAIALANKCALDLSIKTYRKADRLLTQFNNSCTQIF